MCGFSVTGHFLMYYVIHFNSFNSIKVKEEHDATIKVRRPAKFSI